MPLIILPGICLVWLFLGFCFGWRMATNQCDRRSLEKETGLRDLVARRSYMKE